MTTIISVIIALAALGVLVLGLWKYLKLRGTSVIVCPETDEPEAVEVKTMQAVLTGLVGKPKFQLRDCTRWPERQNCGQECLWQINLAPEDCLVRTILTKWYEDKSCVLCGKALGEPEWLEHTPALMNPDRKTVDLREVPADELPKVLSTHQPICWNCHIAETFRREFPNLVIERPTTHEKANRNSF
jgi:hypothetical protein